MPSGHPKDPEATAAKMRAAHEARRAAKAAAGPSEFPPDKRADALAKRAATKRTYKPRSKTLQRKDAAKANLLTETHTVTTQQGNLVKELEDRIAVLDEQVKTLDRSNENLRDQRIDYDRRLMAVLDLLTHVDLRKLSY